MNKEFKIKIALVMGLSCALLSFSSASAGELTYKPLSPSFGGNPFNSSFLLSTAESQKQFSARRRSTASDPLDDFSNTISRRLISRLSSDITNSIFGETAEDSGQFIVGDLTIDFARDNDLVNISIQDAVTGGQTSIELPVVAF